MSNFNFSSLGETSFVNSGSQHLRPFNIYEVNLTKIESSVVKGKDGTEYPVIALAFTGCGEVKGIYEHNLFIPNKDSDFERRVNETSGAKYPSAFEQFQYTLMQLVEVINPTGAKKIKENSTKIKTIEQFNDLVIKAISTKKDVPFFLKLVGKNSGGVFYANLPNACVLAKDATPETKPSAINFVSNTEEGLFFSNYELTQMKAYKDAKPTNMDKKEENPDVKDNDIDLDDISLDD